MSLVSILFPHPARPLFFLQGVSSSYIFGVHPAGYLCHLHWGEKIAPDMSPETLLDREPVAFSPEYKSDAEKAGLDVLRYEYPTANTGDFRTPAVDVCHADGTNGLRLLYHSHRVLSGKPRLAGLPATYVESGEEARTLEVELHDVRDGISVVLSYTVFESRNVIARSAKIRNDGQAPAVLLRAFSASLDIGGSAFEMIHLPGAWGRERWIERHPLHSGTQYVGSRRGASSHQHNPFFALVDPETNETQGEARGFSLVYSGNHIGGAEVDQLFHTRAISGIHPDGFSWHLEPGGEFQTPEVVLAFSAEGLGELSAQYHSLYRERLVRGKWRDRERPVLLNNWEATYFDLTPGKLLGIARTAAELGVELFVLDDGWFGRRNNDTSSLGDWTPDLEKLPEGLAGLGSRIKGLGLDFGLWLEPEMVSRDSELYRKHPDWCLHIPGRDRTEGRNQLVLDFSREEVVQSIAIQLEKILSENPIGYVKWDMNRHLTEVGSAALPVERQGEVFHRHILGVYRLMEHITQKFPEVLFESCSGGGGRYDPGILHYMPQTWCSDNTDAIARLKIQYGTSLVYPPCSMCAHISAVPNHQNARTTPMRTRGHVALAGQFGFELDPSILPPEDLAEAGRLTALAKQTRHLLRYGNFHRLSDPFSNDFTAWMLVAADQGEALVTAVLSFADINRPLPRLKLRGLDPDAKYHCVYGPAGEWPGDVLAGIGLPVALSKDFESLIWHLKRS